MTSYGKLQPTGGNAPTPTLPQTPSVAMAVAEPCCRLRASNSTGEHLILLGIFFFQNLKTKICLLAGGGGESKLNIRGYTSPPVHVPQRSRISYWKVIKPHPPSELKPHGVKSHNLCCQAL